jgi:membrane protein YqaA with SNARE-associated domain
VYLSLFISAFLAATLLPAQSEALLVYQLSRQPDAVAGLVAVATLGNVVGSVTNWCLGRFVTQFSNRPWFPADQKQLQRAERYYHKYGRYSLLLSWAPFIGDPITLIAGLLREPLWSFLILVTVAKCGRYMAVAALVRGFI